MLENKLFKQKIKKIDFWSEFLHLASHSPRCPMESPEELKKWWKIWISSENQGRKTKTIGRESWSNFCRMYCCIGTLLGELMANSPFISWPLKYRAAEPGVKNGHHDSGGSLVEEAANLELTRVRSLCILCSQLQLNYRAGQVGWGQPQLPLKKKSLPS